VKYKLQNENDLMRTYVFDNDVSRPKKPPKTGGSPAQSAAKKNTAQKKKNTAVGHSAPKGSSRSNVRRGSAVRTPDAVKRTKIKVHTVKSTEKKKFPFGTVFSALACTVIFMIMLWSYVQINEETQRIEELEIRLRTVIKEETELELKLEEKNNLKEIEEYAKTKLGMVQIDQLAKKYISVASADKVELVDPDDAVIEDEEPGFFETLKEAFSEKLALLLEYFS